MDGGFLLSVALRVPYSPATFTSANAENNWKLFNNKESHHGEVSKRHF